MRGYRVRQLRANGARARMAGQVSIAGYPPVAREMPRGGPGQYLEPERVDAFTGPALAGDWDTAGAVFERVFGEAYGVDIEMDDVSSLRLWPEGSVFE